MLLIKNGFVHDAIHEKPYAANILVENGKIKAISADLSADAETVDASGLSVYPGFVDAHSHIGLNGYGIGYECLENNEKNDSVCPQLRGIDGFNPFDAALPEARDAGVTTVCVGPGSANVVGGTFAVMKTAGKSADDMCVIPAAAMKCAFGENPKKIHRESDISSRMTVAAKLRELLFKSFEYDSKLRAAGDDPAKAPAFDMKLHAMLPVVRGEIPLKAHAHQTNDILTAIRIAKEFGVKMTLEHVTEGHLVADIIAEAGYPVAVGPSASYPSKYELRGKTWETPAVLHRAGCRVSITCDAPVTRQNFLPLWAGLAIRAGLDPFAALQAITINPARHIGADARVGSLEVGKDADIVLTDGSPFEINTRVCRVWIDGKEVFAAR